MFLSLALATALRFDEAFIGDIRTLQLEILREVLDAAIVRLNSNLRGGGEGILIIDRVFVAHEFLALCIDIGAREVAFPTLLVVEFEGTVQLEVVVGIAETAV